MTIPTLARAITLSGRRLASTSAAAPQALLKTPLHALHVDPAHKAKMTGFAGYDMPLSYSGPVVEGDKGAVAGGPVAEHHQVRNSSGLFDVGHMVQTTYSGPGALAFLSQMLPASLSSLPVPKSDHDVRKSTLSVLLNDKGGILDDCMITRWGQDEFYLVTNAGRAAEDLAWLSSHAEQWNASHGDGEQVTMKLVDDHALIALQGPKSHLALQRLLAPDFSLQKELFFGSSSFQKIASLGGARVHVARTGYTGEDGFELAVPSGVAEGLARMLLEQGEVKLAGLAARDSLRLEAGLCLYGHDLDESTGVGEAGLGWVVGKDRRTAGSFIGAERTLAELKKGGTTRKRVGLVVEKGAPAREGAKIFANGEQVGVVTSGLPAPTVGQNIAMAYVATAGGLNKKGTKLEVEVRGKRRQAEVVGMPWTSPGYYRQLVDAGFEK